MKENIKTISFSCCWIHSSDAKKECEFFITLKKLWNYCQVIEQPGEPGDYIGVNKQQTFGNVLPKKR